MRIGIAGPFNPLSIADYLDENNIPSINESATAVNTLVREFLEQGHQLHVFTLSDIAPNKYRKFSGKDVTIHLIPMGLIPLVFGSHKLFVAPLFLPNRIAKVIKKELSKLDVLHAHWTYEYGRSVSLLSEKIPVFDTVRDWCPYQMTVQKDLRSKLDWKLKNTIFKQVMSNKDVTFIANSNYTHKMITGDYPEKDVPIIPNPIDKKWILNEKAIHTKHQIISIATGLLSPRKNIVSLLEAFVLYKKVYPEAKLHLVGGCEKTDDVYINWEEKGLLDGVVMHGALQHDELAALLDQMSCLVHPSLEETFGNILLEAMSRCVPCIGGKDAGAVPDVLGHGKYGLVCDIESPQAIYEAMVNISDQELSQQLQRDATKMLKKNYSSDIIVKKHIELFQDCLKK